MCVVCRYQNFVKVKNPINTGVSRGLFMLYLCEGAQTLQKVYFNKTLTFYILNKVI